MQPASTSTAISLRQLADLLGVDVSNANRATLELATYKARTGERGKPQLCVSLADLAELIQARTGSLSAVECRLRLALMGTVPPSKYSDRAWRHGTFQLIEQPDGSHIVVPTDVDLDTLPPDVRLAITQATASHNAECCARHEARRLSRPQGGAP
ncbi:hypothetical protein D3C77_153400 [compost metagenome]